MAGFIVGSAVTPFEGGQAADGIIFKTLTAAAGAGDSSEIAAVVADSRHIIVDGRLSAAGTETLVITSDANTLDTLQFIVASTLTFPKGLETNTGEALKIDKGTASAAQGWIKYKTITSGNDVPEVYTGKKR